MADAPSDAPASARRGRRATVHTVPESASDFASIVPLASATASGFAKSFGNAIGGGAKSIARGALADLSVPMLSRPTLARSGTTPLSESRHSLALWPTLDDVPTLRSNRGSSPLS